VGAAAADVVSGAAPRRRFAGPLRGRFLAASALLLAAVVPVACGGGRRDGARLAALEAGIASAQASLATLSAAAPPPAPPWPSGGVPAAWTAGAGAATPVAFAAPAPAGSRPLAVSGLLGAGPDALLRWFGEPDLRRPEGGGAEVMLFLGPGCALDVVLYADTAARGGMRGVAHAAARAEGAAAVTEADCLRGIGAAEGAGGGGWAGRAAAAGHSGRR
jgi:hypothetical protein